MCYFQTPAMQQLSCLFDHLVGAGEQCRRDGEPEPRWEKTRG
jgi:hypothetical protein